MRILLVSYYPLPYTGGVWTFVSLLKKSLEDLGHSVDVLSHTPDTTKYRIIGQEHGIEIDDISPYIKEKIVREMPSLPVNSWIYNVEVFRYSLELSAAYYDLQQYDIIHALDVTAARAMSRVKPPHVPLVTSALGNLSRDIFFTLKTMHRKKTDQELRDTFEYQYHKTLEHLGYQSSSLIHSPTRWMRDNIIDNFSISPDKIMTFSYGLDIENFHKNSIEHPIIGPKKGKKVILFIGRLVYLKGVHHLLDALALLKEDRDDWECWILGKGELQWELEEQCKKLELSNLVRFLGISNDVAHFLREADIFVHPSIHDTQPYSVMEAQLAGLPVLVSNTAGLPEMVEVGRSGLVSSVGNIHELYYQLKYLLENDILRKQLAECTKEWAKKRWSLDTMVNNVLSLYKQAKTFETEDPV